MSIAYAAGVAAEREREAKVSDQPNIIEDAVEAGIKAAAIWVSEGTESFLPGNRGWSSKEFQIAERAAREAIAALRQFEAGK